MNNHLRKLNNSVNAAITYDERDYGAKGDGKTLDSPAINATIDTCLFARHVRGLQLQNVTFLLDQPDVRTAILIDDVEEMKEY